MESVYYVMSWLCHRRCEHCYEDRFHPYYGEELRAVVDEARNNAPRIIEHLPARMTYLDVEDGFTEKPGRVILAGGEILLEAVRQPVLYPSIELLHRKYRAQGGIRIIIQTTGDILTPAIVDELLDRGVWMISVSGMDAYHEGFEEEGARLRLMNKLIRWFEDRGMKNSESGGDPWHDRAAAGPFFHFFGATPDSWIGKLWPRGRAFANELSEATIADNFCNRWSGGLNFLATRYRGSEVSIEPNGNVYPCCIKTKTPVGNLLHEPLETILTRLQGNTVYEAISMGHPERMGIAHGWSVENFLENSRVQLSGGRVYQNLCIGCDRFHEEVLAPAPLVHIRSGS
jgi:MoaA/NifB/PqqE/SkfB family radical SAM enzyme